MYMMKSKYIINMISELIQKLIDTKLFKVLLDKKNRHLIHSILILLIFLSLCFSYFFIIVPNYGYLFTNFHAEFSIIKFIVTILSIFVLLYFSGKITNDFIYCVTLILITYLFFGEAVIWIFNNDQTIEPLVATGILISLLLIFQNKQFKLPQIKIEENKKIKIIIVLAIILFIPFIFYYIKYINLNNLFLKDVYETRLLFREIDAPFFMGYIREPLSRIILPFLIVYFLKKKKIGYVFAFACMIIYIYLCGALKSIFMGLILALFFYKGTYKDKVTYFLICLFLALILGIILFYTIGNLTITGTLLRRIFFVEPRLENVYFDFFRNNYTYYSHTGLGFIDYPYNLPIPLYVGQEVMGYEGLSANVGVLTDGFLSFGYIGLALSCVILVVFFIYVKSINMDPAYFGIFFVYIYYINTSLLSTLLLTHGLFFFCIFCFLIKKENS